MKETVNNLTGLSKFGFKSPYNESLDENLVKSDSIFVLRELIRKYFTKANVFYKGSSSYGLKHYAERYFGDSSYFSNGELIYAMHLEGFKIYRDDPNCFFNIKKSDLSCLVNAKTVLDMLLIPLNYDINCYLNMRKPFQRYKYNFNYIISHKFSLDKNITKRTIVKIISKEISVDYAVVDAWFNLLKDSGEMIPTEKMRQLEDIFNMNECNLINSFDSKQSLV